MEEGGDEPREGRRLGLVNDGDPGLWREQLAWREGCDELSTGHAVLLA